jgi:hypothetical protein
LISITNAERDEIMKAVVVASALALLVGGCYASARVRKLAANDFGCPPDEIVIHELREGYLARGCDKEARYFVQDGGVKRTTDVTPATVYERPELPVDRIPNTSDIGIN